MSGLEEEINVESQQKDTCAEGVVKVNVVEVSTAVEANRGSEIESAVKDNHVEMVTREEGGEIKVLEPDVNEYRVTNVEEATKTVENTIIEETLEVEKQNDAPKCVDNDRDEEGSEKKEEEKEDFLNDEKTSDSKKSHGSQNKKKRRRIVIEESEESDNEIRDQVPRSPSPANSESNESIEALEAKVNEIIASERPGPKSKKTSTHLLKQLEARNLLHNAIVIPAKKRNSNSKKHKKVKRVLDSDEEPEKSVEPDLSDIGLIGDDVANIESLMPEHSDNFVVEGICEAMPIENPILPQDDDEYAKSEDENKKDTSGAEKEKEDSEKPVEADKQNNDSEPEPENKETHQKSPNAIEEISERITKEDIPALDTITVVPVPSDEEPASKTIKDELCDAKEAETFLGDALKSQFSDSPKPEIKKEIDFSANTSTFWGRDDSSEDEWPDYRKSRTLSKGGHRRRRSRYDSDSESSTESSSSDDRRRKKKKGFHSMVKTVSVRKLVEGTNSSYRKNVQKVVNRKAELKKKVKDRFFDRSRLVPNDIYFGDVQVPLHVLHSYNSDAFSSSSDEKPKHQSKSKSNVPRYGVKKIVQAVPPRSHFSTYSPNSDSLIQTMKDYLKAAGIRKIKFSKIWEGCKSNAERANAMLRLLRDKGLVGDPTMAKCRALRKKREAKREIEELDTSVILDDEEGIRTRRTTRSVNKIKEEDTAPVVGLETLNKLKEVIDSESE